MRKLSSHDRLARAFVEQLPTFLQWSEDGTKELVQTSVWLVGLSTGFLGLLTAKPEILDKAGALAPWLITAPLTVVVSGVLLRLVQQIVTGRERLLFGRLRMVLWGMTVEFDDPLPLQEWWTLADILERLKSEFEVDLSPFAQDSQNIELYRTFYSEHLALWEKYEQQKETQFMNMMLAMEGKPPTPDAKANVAVAPTDPLDDIRRASIVLRRWMRVRTTFYWTTGLLFGATAALLAASLLT